MNKLTDERNARRISYRMAHKIPRALILLLCWLLAGGISFLQRLGFTQQLNQNLSRAYADRSKRKIKKITRYYYYHLFLSLFELLFDVNHLPQRESKIFRVTGQEHLTEALHRGKGIIVYAPHIGNFFYYYWFLSKHYDCLAVATATDPNIRSIYLKFNELGCKGIDYDLTPPLQLMKSLRTHLARNGVVFLLGDFYRDAFPDSQFFGHQTRSPRGAALLALQHQIPIVLMKAKRTKGFRHEIRFLESFDMYLSFESHESAEANQFLNNWMESVVRDQPDQWFYWYDVHNRWKENSLHT